MQNNTLVVRFGSLGDVILSSATVLSLKIAWPGSYLTYLTKERFRPVVAMFDGVDDIVTVPDHVSTREFVSALMELDRARFNRVVDLHGNYRSWLTRSLVSAEQKAWYPKRRFERWRMTWRRKHLPDTYPHTIDSYNQTLIALGRRSYSNRPVVHPPDVAEEHQSLFDTNKPVVFIAPGAAHPTKAWPRERFEETARILVEDAEVRVIVAESSGDRTEAGDGFTGDNIERLKDVPIDRLAAIVGRSDLVLANDSGVAHFASAAGTPVLALFGPTHRALGFEPRGLRDRVLEVDEPCRPCSRHGRRACFREERFCFTRLSVNEVATAATEMLRESRALRPGLFLDRDGTIIEDKHYLSDPDGVELIDGAAAAIKRARDLGYRIAVVSNQSGVAKKYHSLEDVDRVNDRMIELLAAEGASVDGIYFCPHHTRRDCRLDYRQACNCRKPGGGMGEEAALDLGIDLRRSLIVGDSPVDIGMGRVLGMPGVLVRTGYGRTAEDEHREELERLGVRVVESIGAAIEILEERR